jgi:hypothetical protein
VVLNKLIVQLIEKENKKEILENEAKKLIPLTILTLMIVAISLIEVKSKIGDEYVSKELYPVEMSEFILNYCEENNIDLADMRLYNEYNYGSYLLFKGIPVFIDSRADLYAPEFNTETGNAEDGRDIFSDFMNVSNLNIFYGDIFEKYNITHIILYKNSKMNLVISNTNDGTYKLLKEDNSFVFYEIVK